MLGYPTGRRVTSKDGDGWVQAFEKGFTIDSDRTTTQVVHGAASTKWAALGRETSPLGYPTAARRAAADGGWLQPFEHGAVCDSPRTRTSAVVGAVHTEWRASGGEGGLLGYPHKDAVAGQGGGRGQWFEGGEIWARSGGRGFRITGPVLTAWRRAGYERGLGYPTDRAVSRRGGGVGQAFDRGRLWVRPGTITARAVTGRVLAAWRAAGSEAGRYGYPTSDTTTAADGTQRCTFEHGTITA
ncbi:hypothetical protein GCM10025868_33080 [Angustibacter aerolatus]|uniref:LGFP repeat-containing protein n=1 Tax=Angustibacter aerolatus TaxID=1162965 RepID=A0ABQ6JIL9_9ACTN|nr:hypothetical protein GCM10025868_33080 [Angustibacter aerolatus]